MSNLGFHKDLPALTNHDLEYLVKSLKINHFQGVFMRDNLPNNPKDREVGIVNLDSSNGIGTHWVCYSKNKNNLYYFDSFGLNPPEEIINYLKGKDKNKIIELSSFQIQKFNTHHCGYYCLLVLKLLERSDFKNTILSLLKTSSCSRL